MMSARIHTRLSSFDIRIEVRCRSCRHIGCVDVMRVTAWFKARRMNDSLDAAGQKFRCTKCGERWPRFRPTASGTALSVPSWGPQDEADYKRLLKRLRD